MPHELILNKPAVLLNPICSYTCLFFALASYKYVGVSVRNTFVNVDGLFYILFLVIYHLLTGNAGFAARLFTPTMAIGLILILGVTIIYPSLRDPQEEKQGQRTSEPAGLSKTALKIGIALAIVSALFDGGDSFISSVMIGDSIVDSMEFIAANTLVQVIITVFVWIYLWIRHKKIYNPFRKTEKFRFVSQAFSIAADVLYIFALSGDALLGVILWNAFPVLDILGARILMKEKLTRTQYLVLFILGVVAASIGGFLSDYYGYTGKPLWSCMMIVFRTALFPILFCVNFCLEGGIVSMGKGMVLSQITAMAVFYSFVLIMKGRESIPYMLDDPDYGKVSMNSFEYQPEEYERLWNWIQENLNAHGMESEKIGKVGALLQALFRQTEEKNGKNKVLGECVLRFIGKPEIIIKDNGALFQPDIQDDRLSYNALLSCNSSTIHLS